MDTITKKALIISIACLVLVLANCSKSGTQMTGSKTNTLESADGLEQTLKAPEAQMGQTVICPVMKSKFKVSKDSLYIAYRGKKYYVCCPYCVEELTKDPGKYLK